MLKSRIAIYLIYPLIGLLLIGIIWNWIYPDTVDSYIIACGPIFSAFVAMYISNVAYAKEKDEEVRKKNTLVEYVTILVRESIKVIEKETHNYTQLSELLATNTLGPKPLSTTSFYFLNRVSEYGNETIYNALVKRQDVNSEQIQQVFLNLFKEVDSAMHIKEIATKNYDQFIGVHNKYAQTWTTCQKELFKLDIDFQLRSSEDDEFYNGFRVIINNFRTLILEGVENELDIDFLLNNLIAQISTLLGTIEDYNEDSAKLFEIFINAKTSLEKLKDIHSQYAEGFESIADKISGRAKNLQNVIDQLD